MQVNCRNPNLLLLLFLEGKEGDERCEQLLTECEGVVSWFSKPGIPIVLGSGTGKSSWGQFCSFPFLSLCDHT